MSNLTDAIAIAGGVFHTCALRRMATSCAGGSTTRVSLGLGNHRLNSNVPVTVDLTQVVDISAGYGHTCAVRANGALSCWGRNAEGQLGNRSFVASLGPTTVSNMTNVKALSAGWFHTCAVRADAVTSCWATTRADRSAMARSRIAIGQRRFITSHCCRDDRGGQHAYLRAPRERLDVVLGLQRLGAAWRRAVGQVSVAAEVQAVTGRSPAISIDGSGSGFGAAGHTCALRGSGGVVCWGINFSGEITGTDDANVFTVTEATGPPAVAAGITVVEGGYGHTCALTVTGTVVCWGGNRSGQIGNGEESVNPVPPTTVPGLGQVVALAAGFESTCALRADGTVQCWGGGALGQLGNGTEDRPTPAEVVGLTNVKAITGGATHYCAIRGTAACDVGGRTVPASLGTVPRPPSWRTTSV